MDPAQSRAKRLRDLRYRLAEFRRECLSYSDDHREVGLLTEAEDLIQDAADALERADAKRPRRAEQTERG